MPNDVREVLLIDVADIEIFPQPNRNLLNAGSPELSILYRTGFVSNCEHRIPRVISINGDYKTTTGKTVYSQKRFEDDVGQFLWGAALTSIRRGYDRCF